MKEAPITVIDDKNDKHLAELPIGKDYEAFVIKKGRSQDHFGHIDNLCLINEGRITEYRNLQEMA